MFNRRPSGFTLLELLVVISIIAILAVSLTPAFARAREAGRRSVCSDNMKQIHYCLTMYEQTEGMFPATSTGTADRYKTGDAQNGLNLLYRQYTDDVRIFSCPSKPVAKTILDNIKPASAAGAGGTMSGTDYFGESQSGVSGQTTSYGYSTGHDSGNSRVVVLADHKGVGGGTGKTQSDNHGKNAGQNMLSAGGSVSFYNDIINNLGRGDDGNPITDSDIFAPDTVVPQGYAEWDSICR